MYFSFSSSTSRSLLIFIDYTLLPVIIQRVWIIPQNRGVWWNATEWTAEAVLLYLNWEMHLLNKMFYLVQLSTFVCRNMQCFLIFPCNYETNQLFSFMQIYKFKSKQIKKQNVIELRQQTCVGNCLESAKNSFSKQIQFCGCSELAICTSQIRINCFNAAFSITNFPFLLLIRVSTFLQFLQSVRTRKEGVRDLSRSKLLLNRYERENQIIR